MKCEYCGKDDELRPYGKNGASICFDCAMLPDNKAITEAMFESQLNAAGPVVLIGEETGPRPLNRRPS